MQFKQNSILRSTVYLLSFLIIVFVIQSCGNTKTALPVHVEPAQTLVSDQGVEDFSLVLHDMDVTEDDEHIIYKHKYMVLNPTETELKIDSTEWLNVSETFFQAHENDLGMEIVSRHGGVVSTVAKPVGFDWAVGNEKHGEWVEDPNATDKSERRWRYRPGSFFMAYWLFSRPTSMGAYNRYSANRSSNKPFYGSGANKYGTSSSYQKANRSSFYKRKAGSKSWSSFKKTKSSSRFKGGSSTRGRSGGVGK